MAPGYGTIGSLEQERGPRMPRKLIYTALMLPLVDCNI